MVAPNSCDPCGTCIPPKMSIDWWRQAVLTVLCQIAGGLPGAQTIVQLADVVKAFSFFTNAYQALGFLDSERKLAYAMITNDSDGVYAVSFNNSTEQYRVLANTTKIIDFQGGNLEAAALTPDMYMKYIVAPTIGNVYVEGFYYE